MMQKTMIYFLMEQSVRIQKASRQFTTIYM